MTAADDPLVPVLEEIAEIEGREGFEGPKITPQINRLRKIYYHCYIPETLFDSGLIGEIGRACDARRGCLYLEGPWPAVPHLGEYKAYIILIDVPKYTGIVWGPSRALAAARAYLAAIKESDLG